MSVTAIYPAADLLSFLREEATVGDTISTKMYEQVQLAVDSGASSVILTGDEFEHVLALRKETQ